MIEKREFTEKESGYKFIQKFFILGKNRWKIWERIKKPVLILKIKKI